MQVPILLFPILVIGSAIYLIFRIFHKTQLGKEKGPPPSLNPENELMQKQYEVFLLGSFGDNLGSYFDPEKIGELLIGSLENVISYDCVSYMMILKDGSLSAKFSLQNTVGQEFIRGVKKRMIDSLQIILNKNLSHVTLDEIIIGKYVDEQDTRRVGSYFHIPLLMGNNPIGVLTVASTSKDVYTADNTQLFYLTTNRVLAMTSRVQAIIESEEVSREKKEREAERRVYQAEILRELGERVGYSLDLTNSIEIITGSIGRLLPYHTISYMVRSKDRIIFKCNIQEPVNRDFVSDVKNKMLQAFSAMLEIPLNMEDIDESITGSIFNENVKDLVNSFFNLPLIINQKIVGLINVASPRSGIYTEEETSILYTITAQASTAVTKLTEVLEREKGKLNALVASLDDGIVMVDPHWNLLVANAMARKILELPEGEITMLDVLDKLSSKIDIRTKIEEAVEKNTTIDPSEIMIGTKILQVVTLQVKAKDKKNLGAVVVFHDITREKQEKNIIETKVQERTRELREEQSRFIAAINSVPRGFIIVNPQGQIIVTNHVLSDILGNSGKEWTLNSINKKFEVASFDLEESYQKCLIEKKPSKEIEVTLGSKFLKVFLAPITLEGSNSIIGVVILIDDVTEAKVMERSKDEFFSIASHELRTPLTAIQGNTALIQQFYADKIKDKELTEMISDIHESSVRLIEIVNDFLNTSRLEQGKMEFKKEEFDFEELVMDSFKELKALADNKKLYLKLAVQQKGLRVVADRDKTKEVLINLVGNSLKFTTNGGITIKSEIEGNFLKVLVSDTGRGISVENQSLLFRKFQQAGSSILTRDTVKGTGLGLYITKMMLEGMGGNIVLQSSEEGKGTTFKFILPLAEKSTTHKLE